MKLSGSSFSWETMPQRRTLYHFTCTCAHMSTQHVFNSRLGRVVRVGKRSQSLEYFLLKEWLSPEDTRLTGRTQTWNKVVVMGAIFIHNLLVLISLPSTFFSIHWPPWHPLRPSSLCTIWNTQYQLTLSTALLLYSIKKRHCSSSFLIKYVIWEATHQ